MCTCTHIRRHNCARYTYNSVCSDAGLRIVGGWCFFLPIWGRPVVGESHDLRKYVVVAIRKVHIKS